MFSIASKTANASKKIEFVGLYYDGGYTTSNSTFTVPLTSLSSGIDTAARAGDLVIAVNGWTMLLNEDGNPGVTTAGYTELTDLYQPGNGSSYSTNMSVSWKIMGSTPDTSVTMYNRGLYNVSPFPLSIALIFVFRNTHQTNPIPTSAATQAAGNNPNPPAITPSTAGSWIFHITYLNGSCNSSVTDMTQVFSGFGLINDVTPSPYVQFSGRAAYKSDWTSGTFDPMAWGTIIVDNTRSYNSTTLVIAPR